MSILRSTNTGKQKRVELSYLINELHWIPENYAIIPQTGTAIGKIRPAPFSSDVIQFQGDRFEFVATIPDTKNQVIFCVKTLADLDLVIAYFNRKTKQQTEDLFHKMMDSMSHILVGSIQQTELDLTTKINS